MPLVAYNSVKEVAVVSERLGSGEWRMVFIVCFVSDTLNSAKEFLANSTVISKYRFCLSQMDRMNMIIKIDMMLLKLPVNPVPRAPACC